MTIVSSVFSSAPQRDGRHRVIEVHTDHLGSLHERTYLADASFDVGSQLAARAAEIDAALGDEEFQRNLRRILKRLPGGLTTNFLTVVQLRARLRAYYQSAPREEVIILAAFFLTLSDAQLQNLFGVTAGQLPALKTRLQTRADVLASLDAATGE